MESAREKKNCTYKVEGQAALEEGLSIQPKNLRKSIQKDPFVHVEQKFWGEEDWEIERLDVASKRRKKEELVEVIAAKNLDDLEEGTIDDIIEMLESYCAENGLEVNESQDVAPKKCEKEKLVEYAPEMTEESVVENSPESNKKHDKKREYEVDTVPEQNDLEKDNEANNDSEQFQAPPYAVPEEEEIEAHDKTYGRNKKDKADGAENSDYHKVKKKKKRNDSEELEKALHCSASVEETVEGQARNSTRKKKKKKGKVDEIEDENEKEENKKKKKRYDPGELEEIALDLVPEHGEDEPTKNKREKKKGEDYKNQGVKKKKTKKKNEPEELEDLQCSVPGDEQETRKEEKVAHAINGKKEKNDEVDKAGGEYQKVKKQKKRKAPEEILQKTVPEEEVSVCEETITDQSSDCSSSNSSGAEAKSRGKLRKAVDSDQVLPKKVTENVLSRNQAITLAKLRIIIVPWEPAPLHLIETSVIRLPTAEQLKQISEQKLTVKKGEFSAKEDEILMNNWRSFCRLHDIEKDASVFLRLKHLNIIKILQPKHRLNFVRSLAKNLDHRLLMSVYGRFKTICNKRLNTGRFTKAEDEVILDYIGTHSDRIKLNFSQLALILNRDVRPVKSRVDILTKPRTKQTEISPLVFTECELKNFVKELMKVTETSDVQELKNKEITSECWHELSDKLYFPAKTLKRTWQLVAYPRLFLPESCDLKTLKESLIQRIQDSGAKNYEDIDWEQLAAGMDGCTPQLLRKMFKEILDLYVPQSFMERLTNALFYLQKAVVAKHKLRTGNRFEPLQV